MEHIEKNILEKYIISREDFTPGELDNITAHLAQCAYCKEHAEKLTAFYDGVSKELQAEPTDRDKAFADKLLARQWLAIPEKKLALQERVDNALSTFVEIIEPYHRPLAKRFIRYIRIHPIRVASGFSMAAALVFATLLIQPMFKDKNPSYARAKEEFLVVYNKEGEVLWKRHVGMGYDFDRWYRNKPEISIDNFVTTVDVDQDGKNEIIAIYGWCPQPVSEKANNIVCYNSDGNERWKYEFHRQMTFGSERFADDYQLVKTIVGDFDKNGSIEVVAVALHIPYYPTAIIRFDARTGNVLDEYWHSGVSWNVVAIDLDRDGIDDLIFPGTSNGFNQASLLVLDPRKMSGHAPAPPAYRPIGIPEGREKYFILLPQTDVCRAGLVKRNGVSYIRMTGDSLLQVDTWELQEGNIRPGMIYYFDSAMRCVRVDANDYFVKAHRQLVEKGKLSNKLDERYYKELWKGVRYWDGQKFVNYPTMNKKYVEVAIRLP